MQESSVMTQARELTTYETQAATWANTEQKTWECAEPESWDRRPETKASIVAT